MNAEEVFLNCSNLTLGQYRAVVIARGLTGAAGCVVSLGILVIVLLIAKKKEKSLETSLTERIYLATILCTLLYSAVAIAAVNYSHPPSQESAWCGVLGFLLQYSGTLVVVHYCAVAFAITLPIVRAVYKPARDRSDSVAPRKAIPREVFLYLILFLCPILNSWEPFLPQLPLYGNYGPLCWFRLELTENCTANTLDVRFLQAVPFAVLSFAYCVTFTISLFALCGRYFQSCTTKPGCIICRFFPILVVLTVITFVLTAWFIVSAVPSKSLSDIRSFSTWLENVTATLAATIGVLVAVGVYIHFPTHLCEHCWSAGFQLARRQQPENTPLVRHSVGHSINEPTFTTNFSPAHSTVTTTEPHPSEVDCV